jgi:hypothetical protein
MLRQILVSPPKESSPCASTRSEKFCLECGHIFLMTVFGALVISMPTVSAQSTQQTVDNSNGSSQEQICDQSKKGDQRDLSLTRTSSEASDVESSGAEQTPSSEGSSNLVLKELHVSKPGNSSPASEKQELQCKKDPEKSTSEHSTDAAPGEQLLSVEPQSPARPLVTYTNGKLTIDPHNAQLGEIIEAIRARTGLSVEFPPEVMDERIFDRVGPVSLREALIQLLYGSGFNYIFQTASGSPEIVKKLVLSARTRLPLPASAQHGSEASDQRNEHEAVYGGNGFNEVPTEVIEAATPLPPPVKPTIDPSTVPGIPAGFNLQEAAAQANKTPAQILDEMQKRQLELLDAQAPPP